MAENTPEVYPNLSAFYRCVIREYVKHGNKADAYRKAVQRSKGKLPKSPEKVAYEVFRRDEIKQAVEEKLTEFEDKADVSHLRVLAQDRDLAFADVRDLFQEDGAVIPPHELPENVAKCVKKITQTTTHTKQGDEITTFAYEFWDKHKALDRLFRYLKMGPDTVQRQEHTGKNGGPVQHKHTHSIPPEAHDIFERITGRSFSEVYEQPNESSQEEGI